MKHMLKASDGVSLAYYVDDFTAPWGTPETIILLHSMMGHAGRFYRWVPPLARSYRVVRVDLRGHGASEVPGPDLPLTMERLRDDLAELYDHLGLKTAHVVGNSAGGYVAQVFAIAHPGKVASLSLFGSTPGLKRTRTAQWIPLIQKEGLLPFLTRTISDRFPLDRVETGLVDWFLSECGRNDQDFICRWLALTTSVDWTDALEAIACPTLIVRPGGETVGVISNYDAMAEIIPDTEMLTYQGLPHNICDIVPDQCVSDVLAFLARRFPVLAPAGAA